MPMYAKVVARSILAETVDAVLLAVGEQECWVPLRQIWYVRSAAATPTDEEVVWVLRSYADSKGLPYDTVMSSRT